MGGGIGTDTAKDLLGHKNVINLREIKEMNERRGMKREWRELVHS